MSKQWVQSEIILVYSDFRMRMDPKCTPQEGVTSKFGNSPLAPKVSYRMVRVAGPVQAPARPAHKANDWPSLPLQAANALHRKYWHFWRLLLKLVILPRCRRKRTWVTRLRELDPGISRSKIAMRFAPYYRRWMQMYPGATRHRNRTH